MELVRPSEVQGMKFLQWIWDECEFCRILGFKAKRIRKKAKKRS